MWILSSCLASWCLIKIQWAFPVHSRVSRPPVLDLLLLLASVYSVICTWCAAFYAASTSGGWWEQDQWWRRVAWPLLSSTPEDQGLALSYWMFYLYSSLCSSSSTTSCPPASPPIILHLLHLIFHFTSSHHHPHLRFLLILHMFLSPLTPPHLLYSVLYSFTVMNMLHRLYERRVLLWCTGYCDLWCRCTGRAVCALLSNILGFA